MAELLSIELQFAAVVLAEERSFSAAAERLGTSPAALSALMWELAKRLECRLFRERGDKVELTKDGQVFVDAFRAFLAQSGKMQE
jgi:DNA-binding transcriptional LysR family regulator